MPTPVQELQKLRSQFESTFRKLDQRADRIRAISKKLGKAIAGLPESRDRTRIIALLRDLATALDEIVIDDRVQWIDRR